MTLTVGLDAGLVTFGDGSLGYRRAAKRVANQSKLFQIFKTQVALTKKDLINDFKEESKLVFWDKPFLGYYAWKPLVLKWALKYFPTEVDLIYYVDSGSWVNFNTQSKNQLVKDLYLAKNSGGLVFSSGCLERHYTKAELFEEFKASKEQINSIQLAGGQWILRRDIAESISSEWWNYASQLNLIDSNFDPKIQYPDFIANRNDQSIFSLIMKKQNVSLSPNKIDVHPALSEITVLEKSIPFWASRHRSGSLSMSMNPFRRALRAAEQFLP